ncbi:hypothetical protein EDD58_10824 [Hazenella coriacea]|uniref:Uncharacterized protein n=1 Tax=Hazenella coriacea TaxID=1179467 RepID=A0A4R3L3I8_9BACL|nr:hypothetical protein EDD58_10824 [Hazenella coriacea]
MLGGYLPVVRPNRGVTRQTNKVTCCTKLVTGRRENQTKIH